MKQKVNLTARLSLKKELSKNEMKQVVGGLTVQTYCDGTGWAGPFPVSGSTAIGCQPAYCQAAHHGNFLYCA